MIEAEDIIGVKLVQWIQGAKASVWKKDSLLTWKKFQAASPAGLCQIRMYITNGIVVHSLKDGTLYITGNGEIEGIPFNEDWAKRCGFHEVFDNVWRLLIEELLPNIEFRLAVDEFSLGGVILKHIKYLHQVMQLYYDLTGNVLKPDLTGL